MEQNSPLYFFPRFYICVRDTCLKETYPWQIRLEDPSFQPEHALKDVLIKERKKKKKKSRVSVCMAS